MSAHRWPNIKAFYAMRGGEHSGEDDFGVWWYEGATPARGPRFRVSVVHDTGDVYALNQWDESVELLATLAGSCAAAGIKHDSTCVYNVAERLFKGWADDGPKPLAWARERLPPVEVRRWEEERDDRRLELEMQRWQ